MKLFSVEAVDCGNHSQPENGEVSMSTSTLDSMANFSCKKGFILQGSSTRECLKNRSWSGIAALCFGEHKEPIHNCCRS